MTDPPKPQSGTADTPDADRQSGATEPGAADQRKTTHGPGSRNAVGRVMPGTAPIAAFSAGRSSRITALPSSTASFVAIVSPLTHHVESMRGHATRMPMTGPSLTPLGHQPRSCRGRSHPHAPPLLGHRARLGAKNFEVSYSFKLGRHGPLSERSESPCYERNFGLAFGSRWVEGRADSEPVSYRGSNATDWNPLHRRGGSSNKHPPPRARLSPLTPNRCRAVNVTTAVDEIH